MTTAIFEPISTVAASTLAASSLTVSNLPRRAPQGDQAVALPDAELVGSHSTALTQRLEPMVLSRNVALDMRSVKRIDAAGIAALAELYRTASAAGHRFSLTNVPARVLQILAVVGLDKLLVARSGSGHTGIRTQRSAA